MLKFLRKKGVMKKLLWIVAVVIILVFGFLANAYLITDNQVPTYAGKIFGRMVTLEEFQRNYEQARIQAFIQYGKNYEKVRQFLNLEAETWDRIILLHEAKRRKIKIPDEEVVVTIKNYSFFQRDGKFDQPLYNDILRYVFKIKTRDFEEGVRETLKFSRLYEEETGEVNIPGNELFAAYQQQNQKVQISYILFESEKFKGQIAVDEGKIQEYFEANKQSFVQPPMINVEYIVVKYSSEETPAPEETKEETAEADLEQQKTAAYQKAFTVARALTDSDDFEQVALENDLQVQASGFFSREQPNLKAGWSFPLIQEIFQLETGQVHGPVETSPGYQVLRIKEKRDADIPDLAKARDQVVEAWTMAEAKKLAELEAKKYALIIREEYEGLKVPDFAEIAKEHDLSIYQTPVFTRGQYLPIVGPAKNFQQVAFSLTEDNRLSNVVEIDKGHSILHLDNIVPVDQNDFDKEKDTFAQTLMTEKRNAAFNDFISYLRLKAELEDNISKLLARQN